MASRRPSFSIIIPSFNEGDDVRLSIESALAQDLAPCEVLVVDDSTDRTSDIIREYAGQGVTLVPGPRRGCCGARNLGMRRARGDVVVLLNADVRLPPDFLTRIARHYAAGADYALVESEVINQEKLFARFIEMSHRDWHARFGAGAEWTEGFSCRREAAAKVGFIPGDYPVTFCRDWFLGKALHEAGFKKVIDRSIMVTHRAPERFPEYWRVRRARGRFSALTQRFILKRPPPSLVLRFLAKDALIVLHFVTVLPAAVAVARMARFSPRPVRDFFLLFWPYLVQELGRALGEWEGWFMALRMEREGVS